MYGYLSADNICSKKRTVFWERSSRKTVSIEGQIISKDKYPSMFSCQMEPIEVIILQIFFVTRAVLKIGKYSWSRVMHLDQSCPSKNFWWIINTDIDYQNFWLWLVIIFFLAKLTRILDNFMVSSITSVWYPVSKTTTWYALHILLS